MAASLWVAVALTVLVSADRCPSLSCVELPDGLCAESTSLHSLQVNMYACPPDSYCSVTQLLNWAYESAPGGEFNCTPADSFRKESFLPGIPATPQCGIQELGKDLKIGFHPKVCQTENDCELEDGSLSPCMCGANGFSYCLPHLSSRVYESYWDTCTREVGHLDNDFYAAWMMQYSFYPILQSPVQCARRLFFEYEYLEVVVQASGSSAWTLVPLGVAVLLY